MNRRVFIRLASTAALVPFIPVATGHGNPTIETLRPHIIASIPIRHSELGVLDICRIAVKDDKVYSFFEGKEGLLVQDFDEGNVIFVGLEWDSLTVEVTVHKCP